MKKVFLFTCIFLTVAIPVFGHSPNVQILLPLGVLFIFVIPLIIAKKFKGMFLGAFFPEFYFHVDFPGRSVMWVTVVEQCILMIISIVVFQFYTLGNFLSLLNVFSVSVLVFLVIGVPLLNLVYLSNKRHPLHTAKTMLLFEYSYILGLMVPLSVIISLVFFYVTYPVWLLLFFMIF